MLDPYGVIAILIIICVGLGVLAVREHNAHNRTKLSLAHLQAHQQRIDAIVAAHNPTVIVHTEMEPSAATPIHYCLDRSILGGSSCMDRYPVDPKAPGTNVEKWCTGCRAQWLKEASR